MSTRNRFGLRAARAACAAVIALAATAGYAQSPTPAEDPPGIGSAPGRTSLTGASTRIALENGAMMVRINGSRPLKLFFDSGANAVILKPDVQAELKLPVVGRGTVGARVAIDTLAAGGLTLSDFTGVVIDAGLATHVPFDGVIGLTLFSAVTISWTPDSGDMDVTAAPLEDGPHTYDYRPAASGRLVTLPVEMAGRTVDAVLDIGSHMSVIVPTALSTSLPLEVDTTKSVRLGGPGIAPSTGHPGVLAGLLTLGGLAVERPAVIVADLRHATGELSAVVNIGRPILRRARLTIDQRAHRVRIEPAAPR